MTTSRAPFDAATPDRLTFTFPASRQTADSTACTPISLPPSGPLGKARQTYNAFLNNAKEIVANNTGMLLIAASQGFFALMNVAVKKLNSLEEPVSAMQLVSVRMSITWLCCVTYMYFMKVPDPFLGPKGVRLLLVLRGFCGFFGLFGVYYSLQYLSLSDATVLTFLAPMGTCVTGAIFLKESLTWRQVVSGLCSLVGVVMIARPAALFGRAAELEDISLADGTGHIVEGVPSTPHVTPAQRLTAVGVALIGVVGAIGAYTTIRAVGKRAHPLHNLVSFSSQCIIVSTVAMIAMKTKYIIPLRIDWLAMLLMIGIFGFLAQVLLTMGLQREAVGRGTMAVYTQVVYALIFDQIFFHTSPSPLSIVGTLIIVCSALYVAVTKENTGKHKRARSLAPSAEDITLEEGLLAGAEHDEDVEVELSSKEALVDKNEHVAPVPQHERPRSDSSSSGSSTPRD